jgi:osmotically-inducible protein OsmY
MDDDTSRFNDDQKLRARVLDALTANARFTHLDLRVGVHNGLVHLGGGAPSLGIRSQVEQLVSGIPGVRGVVNRIHAPGAPSPIRRVNLNLSYASKNNREKGDEHEN